MERVYYPGSCSEDQVLITGNEAHHLLRVRRVQQGDMVEIFNGVGGLARGRVARCDRKEVEIAIDSFASASSSAHLDLTLATAVPKGDRFDWLIEKATELGVSRIVPLRTERSVVDPRSTKLDRVRKLVIEACKQSGRNHLMEIAEPISWLDFLSSHSTELGLIAHPGGGNLPLREGTRKVSLAIGPEGGFTDREIQEGETTGWITVGLGPNILRIETAGLAASATLVAGLSIQEGS